METILVPVDFSKYSINAANYAAKFAKEANASRIILLNAYYVSLYESILPSADFIQLSNEEIDQKRESLTRHLRALKARLQPLAGEQVTIDYHLSDLPLLKAIRYSIDEQKIDLVIIGSAGENATEEGVLGRSTIGIARSCRIPLLVCPPGALFSSIKRVVFACDLKKVAKTFPLNELKGLFDKTKPQIMVLNVDPYGHHLQPEAVQEESALRQLLTSFNPEFHYTDNPDTISGIVEFAEQKDTQLIIALPKKYNFLQNLVHDSVSQRLALKAERPLLILK